MPRKTNYHPNPRIDLALSNLILDEYESSGLGDTEFTEYAKTKLGDQGLNRTHIETRRKKFGLPLNKPAPAEPKSRIGVGQRPFQSGDMPDAGWPEILEELKRINATLLRVERLWKPA